ncbi:MAG: YitT family protein, partial [Chlamydiia bacterium]|nr:YitT family protein [Chlamydiia bacterium]
MPQAAQSTLKKRIINYLFSFIGMSIGAFFAALAIRVFLIPNQLIDGGVVGISLILARIYGDSYLSYFLLILNIPFIFLAFRYIRRNFVAYMLVAIVLFAYFLYLLERIPSFGADPLEAIIIGGA